MTKLLLTAIFLGAIAAPSVLPQEERATKKEKDVQIDTGKSKDTHIELESREGTTRLIDTSSKDGVQIELNIKGVRFNDDYTAVESLTTDGFFLLRETRAGVRRKIEIEPDASGQPKYSYFVEGDERPYDAEARAWFAQAMKDRVEHGFDARERVARLYKARGATGVLDAARSLKTSYARSLYFSHLLKIDKPSAETVHEILERVARDEFSDYERANLLGAIAKQHLSGSQGRRDFFEAVKHIESDYYRSQVLVPVLKRGDLDDEWALLAIKAVGATSSHYEKARVLVAAAKAHPDNETVRAAVLDAASGISSEYYRKSVLSAVSRNRKMTSTDL